MTTIVDIGGVDIRSAPVLARDCAFPITNLARRCPPDEFFNDMPIFFGGWEDGVKAPSITGAHYKVTKTNCNDPCTPPMPASCRSPIVTMNLDACEVLAPNMKCISLSTPVLEWRDLVKRFCSQRGIAGKKITVFDRDGNLDFGQKHTLNMVQFALQAVWNTLGEVLVEAASVGDDSEELQFDGFFTQLQHGWTPSTAMPCPDEFNKEQAIDWAALTGKVKPGPDDCTAEGKTVTIWGKSYEVPGGINLAEFLDDLWVEKLQAEGVCSGEVTDWELLTPWGQGKCFINTVACMKACSTCEDDPNVRERLSSFRSGKMVKFYPSNTEVRVKQSRFMPAHTLRFGPRAIDRNPTYGLFVDLVDNYLSMLPTDPFDRFKFQSDEESSFLCAQDWRSEIETRGVFWNLKAFDSKCVQGSSQICAGVLATARHLWLRIDNVYCGSLIDSCATNITVE